MAKDAPRLDALELAGDLPGLLLDARRLAASAPGAHGRRRAGQGEAFWQYRDYRAEDGARMIDWRRSGRGDRYYVREREREAAQTAWFWVDPDPGFEWSGAPSERPSKRRRALTLALALSVLLTRGGERVGALGAPSRAGPRAMEHLALDLARAPQNGAPPPRGFALYASDFYAPIETWRARLSIAAKAGVDGALLCVADPAEELFPFQGRTRFRAPGGGIEALLGRAETAREAFQHRLEAQREAVRALGADLGFPVLFHRTDHSAAPALAALIALIEERR